MIYGRIYFPTYGNGLKEITDHLGFLRTNAADGLQSIAWRYQWESSPFNQAEGIKDRLLHYNRQDCEALAHLVLHLKFLNETEKPNATVFCEQLKRRSPYGWGRNSFAFPELEFVNQRAYFDYQQEKIYWRTSEELKRRRKRRQKRENVELPIDEVFNSGRPKHCPHCFGSKIVKHQASSRVVQDLKFSDSGVKRWLIKYQNHRFICQTCRKTFHPPGHPETTERYGHGLIAWSIYQNIALRQSQESVATGLNTIFGFNFNRMATVAGFKERAAKFYRPAYDEILRALQKGDLIHADETQVSVKGQRHYVWVFTNLYEVIYAHAPTREGSILTDTLAGFKGVLVSDYYPAYDSIQCRQQRCLIHLIRDMNDDLFKHPFDLEYKELVKSFAELLKPIMLTIDKFGLKRRYLRRHKAAVADFYRKHIHSQAKSDMTRKFQTRFVKNEHRLFTFMDYDGVPWNNNNAENAIKGFAALRRMISGPSTEKGLKDSLVLLSICQTLRNKGCSSLDFFRSKEVSLERYMRGERISDTRSD